MNAYDPTRFESTDLDDRATRALTEYLTVLPEAPDLYTVYSQSGETYTVDLRATPACECPDFTYRDDVTACKHIARCQFETGARPVPASVDPCALPADFAAHVDASPVVAATDGGAVLEDDADAERPAECDCSPRVDFPCFPCFKRGFETANPDATLEDD